MSRWIKDTVVFDVPSETFTKFTGLNIQEAHPLSYGTLAENYVLILTDTGQLLRYPGETYTEEPAELQTRDIYMNDGIVKYVKPQFHGEQTQVAIYVHDPYYPGTKKADVNRTPYPDRWFGIRNAESRGEKFSIEFRDADIVYGVQYKYQLKGEGV